MGKAKGGACLVGAVITPVILAFANFGLAYLIYFFGSKEDYNLRIGGENQGYYFLGAYMFSRTITFLNSYPGVFKVVAGVQKIGPNNAAVYKVIGENAPVGKVLLETEGDIGAYNRANRATAHFVEN